MHNTHTQATMKAVLLLLSLPLTAAFQNVINKQGNVAQALVPFDITTNNTYSFNVLYAGNSLQFVPSDHTFYQMATRMFMAPKSAFHDRRVDLKSDQIFMGGSEGLSNMAQSTGAYASIATVAHKYHSDLLVINMQSNEWASYEPCYKFIPSGNTQKGSCVERCMESTGGGCDNHATQVVCKYAKECAADVNIKNIIRQQTTSVQNMVLLMYPPSRVTMGSDLEETAYAWMANICRFHEILCAPIGEALSTLVASKMYTQKQLMPDNVHFSALAQYSNAAVLYAVVTGRSPVPVQFAGGVGITAEAACKIRSNAWSVYKAFRLREMNICNGPTKENGGYFEFKYQSTAGECQGHDFMPGTSTSKLCLESHIHGSAPYNYSGNKANRIQQWGGGSVASDGADAYTGLTKEENTARSTCISQQLIMFDSWTTKCNEAESRAATACPKICTGDGWGCVCASDGYDTRMPTFTSEVRSARSYCAAFVKVPDGIDDGNAEVCTEKVTVTVPDTDSGANQTKTITKSNPNLVTHKEHEANPFAKKKEDDDDNTLIIVAIVLGSLAGIASVSLAIYYRNDIGDWLDRQQQSFPGAKYAPLKHPITM